MSGFYDTGGGIFGGPGFLNRGRGLQYFQPQNNYSKHAFYVDFADGKGTDRVSHTSMETVLSAGRVKPDGTVLGLNEPCIQDGKLNTLGQIELLNGMTDNISDVYWGKADSPIITGTDGFQATKVGSRLMKSINTAEGSIYTLSFYARTEGITQDYLFFHYESASGNSSVFELTPERQRVSVSVLGKIGGGFVAFGVVEPNSSNFPKVHIDTINITKSAYLLPPVHNATAGPLTIPHGYSDSDEGYKWPIASCPKLLTALQGTAGNNAMGTIEVEWVPQFSAANVAIDQNILTANDGADWLLSYNGSTQQIKATDGTNTAVVACSPVAGTVYKIQLKCGDNSGLKMQLVCNETEGSVVAFDGNFSSLTKLAVGWDSATDNWQQLKSIKIKDGNPWI